MQTRCLTLAGLLISCGLVASLFSAEPTVRAIDIRGLQLGATTTITIDGTDLASNPRLLFSFAATQKLRDGATATKAVFEVTPDEQVSPGLYNLRVATDDGVTAPVIIGVDGLPQVALTPKIAELPAALHGSVTGSNIGQTSFTGQAGQEVLIEVEAQRLGSKLRPVIHLYDDQRVQLSWAWPPTTLAGDARLTAKLPADGVYHVHVQDMEYAAATPSYFRLKIGSWQYAEQVFPPVIPRATTAVVELLGNLPATQIDVTPTAELWLPLEVPAANTFSGLRPRLAISHLPEVVETASKVTELSSLPIGVSGRLSTPGEQDRLRLSVAPGYKLRFEIFAERCGSPLDAVLLVLGEKGQPLARGEDSPGSVDPVLEYTVPEKVESLELAIGDLHGRGGPRCIYRLTIESLTAESASPNFQLKLAADRLRVPRDDRGIVPVYADRRGYTGPIQLSLDGLPAGVTCGTAEIPSQCEGALLTLNSSGAEVAQSLARIRGVHPDGSLSRVAAHADHPLAALQPWLAEELAVAVIAPSGFTADWGELASDATLPLGSKLKLPIKVSRPEGQKGIVRVSLLTSQDPPKNNNRPDPNGTLRAEAAIELPADKSEGEMSLAVPASLTSPAYDLALQAELLSADKKTVLATAFTSVRHIATLLPLTLNLASHRYEAVLDAKTGATIKIAGKIERLADLKADVTITVTGLPAGIRVAPLVVKGDATDFELPLAFPANTKPAEITGIKLSASATPDARVRDGVLKTEEQEVLIVLKAAE